MKIQTITSRDNAQVRAIKKLAQSSNSYKAAGLVWLEGEHLCDAYLLSKQQHELKTAVLSDSQAQHWLTRLKGSACDVLVLPDHLLAHISSLPSPSSLGFVLGRSVEPDTIHKNAHTVILDRVQDAGNVGSILRSAAAFGVQQVLAIEGTASLWSPKVLRAAMGAHFSLHLIEDVTMDAVQLDIPILATHVHGGADLQELQLQRKLPSPCAWVLGHEGQGVSQIFLNQASQLVCIQQVGQESLNVAAAAAVCLYASMSH